MKKLTLLLCACAMALAGALVSCKNAPEEYVFTNSTQHSYQYLVTGSIVDSTESGTPESITKATITKDIKKGDCSLSWTEYASNDYDNAERQFSGYIDYDRTNADETVDYNRDDWISFGFRPTGEKDKYTVRSNNSNYRLYDVSEATITGEYADSVTITFTDTIRDNSTDSVVDKQTVVYTFNLKKIGK